jgi:outer membrane murein-binding lipoprotein Lpp
MKSFIAAIVLLAALTGIAFLASGILTAKADALTEAAEALPAAPQEERAKVQQEIAQIWESERFVFLLTVNRNEIDALEMALARLGAATSAKGDDEFLTAASELAAAISRIRDTCAVSLDNIL